MTLHAFEPGTVLRDVAVFPLPQVVLFPGVLMPLHIFEPRYRAMTRDALETTGLIAVALIPEHHQLDALGQPEIARVAAVGRIVAHEQLTDGRYNLVLNGCARVRVDELPFVPPYRRARLTVLPTHDSGARMDDVRALTSTALRFADQVRECHPAFRFSLPAEARPGELADLCAHFLVLDGEERQKLLETLDDAERVQRCLDALLTQCSDLETEETLH